jgi:adenine-specific DNA methylase
MNSERAKAVVTYLGIALDHLISSNSSLTRWVPQRENIAGTFTRQALPMIWDYAEANPLSTSTRNWSGTLDRIAHVIEHTAQASGQSAAVQQGTATRLPYRDDHFDVVVADPPYYDVVPYAELSDFFYVWLKRSVGFLHPDLFSTHLSPKSEEIVQKPTDDGVDANTEYEQKLTKAFAEAGRVLNSNGILIVVFPYRTHASLAMLTDTLLKTGFDFIASWPLQAERVRPRVRLHSHGTARLPPPVPVLVCRKQAAEPQTGDYPRVRAQVRARTREALRRYPDEDAPIEYLFSAAIGPAMQVFGRNRLASKDSGECATVSEVLQEIQEEIIDFVLVRELVNAENAKQ